MEDKDLLSKTIIATKIVTEVTIIKVIIQFITQIILIRLLAPQIFGLFIFVQMIVGFFGLFANIQGRKAVIKEKINIQLTADVAFTTELILSIGMIVILIVSTSTITHWLGKPELVPYIQVLAFSLLLNAFLLTPRAIFERELDFRKSNISILIEVIINAIVSVLLALLGLGIWSLIYGLIAGKTVGMTVLWKMLHYRPQLHFDLGALKKLIIFGLPITLSGTVAYLYSNVDNFIVGRILGNEQLGYYWFAFNIPHLLLATQTNIGTVIFPAFSRAEGGQLERGFNKATKLSAIFFLLPCAIVLSFGKWIIQFIFGPKWLPALLPFKIFMILITIRGVIISHWTDFYMLKGKTVVFLYISLFYLGLITTLGYLAIRFNYGITGMAWVVLFTIGCSTPIVKFTMRTILKYSYIKILWPQFMIFFITLGCGILLREFASKSFVSFLASVILVFCSYIISMFLLDREMLSWIKNTSYQAFINKDSGAKAN